MPELVWKAYIDFFIADENNEKARELFKRLLDKSKNCKVWLGYAQFEKSVGDLEEARKILENAENYFKENPELKEVNFILISLFIYYYQERVFLLESWL